MATGERHSVEPEPAARNALAAAVKRDLPDFESRVATVDTDVVEQTYPTEGQRHCPAGAAGNRLRAQPGGAGGNAQVRVPRHGARGVSCRSAGVAAGDAVIAGVSVSQPVFCAA